MRRIIGFALFWVAVGIILALILPNTFVEVGENCLEVKINALATYRGVMRPFPHPRSAEAIKGLAAYRGAQSGTNYAEAFECTLRRL